MSQEEVGTRTGYYTREQWKAYLHLRSEEHQELRQRQRRREYWQKTHTRPRIGIKIPEPAEVGLRVGSQGLYQPRHGDR